jgi:RNA polymerase sigma factor (sigma-70 family)
MMTTKLMPVAANNDAELVVGTLTGDRDAFSRIVSRYQSLICSLTYSATGNLGQSEDLAQETFISAWKHLGQLRERDKLRSWLCGIARNRINNFLRREGREPLHKAGELDEISEIRSPEPLPVEYTISNEEQAILWRSLECIPEIYREPLVLFYREHQSIESVAQNLELTEDAVKQRLSRGRKMLHEQVLAFVEGALERTAPGKAFTVAVVAALPMAVTTTKAASVGAALAKGGAAAKGVATVGTLGGLFAMLGGAYISFKAHVDDAKSPRERKFMQQWHGKRMLLTLAVFALFFAAMRLDFFHAPIHRDYLLAAGLFVFCVCSTLVFAYHCRRRQQIQIEDNTFVAAEWTMPRKVTDSTADADGAKSKDKLKVARFMAFGIGMMIFVMTQESWKEHLGHAVLITAYFALALFWCFLQWQNRPRFNSLRAGWFRVFPVLAGLATLLSFNRQQYLALASSDPAHIASPAEVFNFNLMVVLTYAAFIGILVWKRKTEFQSMPLKK